MDQSSTEIKEYIDNLVPVIKTAVMGQEWHKRVAEIGQKYSLNPDQISSLEYEVLFVMIGMEPEEDLPSNIQKELNISAVLAAQISEEVNTRVFQYILKLMQDRTEPKAGRFVESKDEIRNTEKGTVKPNISMPNYSTPVKPPSPLLSDIETMAGSQTVSYQPKEVLPPTNLPGAEEEVVENKNTYQGVTFEPEIVPEKSPINANNDTIATPPTLNTPASFADAKLNNLVKSEVAPAAREESPPQTENPIVKNYSADPYREPLE